MKLSGFFVLAVLVLVISCTTSNGVYEKMSFFSKHQWVGTVRPTFNFEVTDTTSLYRMFFVIRHTDAYHFKNIWVNIAVKAPDTSFIIKREFTLADNEKWLGNTVDDIVEQRIPFEKSNIPVPMKKGTYTFTLQQVMREDPLLNVMNAGIRVEKVE